MNVYNQIATNKRRTYLILFIFVLIFSGFFYLIGQFFESPNTYLVIGLIFSVVSGFVSYFYSDKIILLTVGAMPAEKKRYFDLYTVTENLCLATGMPMPKLYVINDPAPNAFATGRNPKNAVVCVTSGLLQILDRSDLEGVIAHELSHIKNYDILLASIVATLVGTISLVADWILRSMWWNRRDNERRDIAPAFYILFVLALILVPLIATLIQLAISRRREYLADASAVLITRNKMGLISALQKISQTPMQLSHATTGTAHLFIVNPFSSTREWMGSWLQKLFSTHPPIEERIKALSMI
jgi:heat shock protein HtpX